VAVLSTLVFSSSLVAQAPFEQRYPYPYPPYDYRYARDGELKINVKPSVAGVYVDGYYAGQVDDFDGPFQELRLPGGEHEIVVYLKGHRPLRETILVNPGTSRKIGGKLEPLGPGEPDPGPPAAAPTPTASTAGTPGRPSQTRAGLLAIRVQPGDAEILIDGQRWEASAGDQRLLVEVSEGRHVVEVRKSGYRPFSTEIVIRPRQTTPLNVSLTRE
jgi:hypothetical protein